MKLATDDRCLACGEVDTPRHAFFRCEAFKADRLAVDATLGTFTPETCVTKMCGSMEAWEAVARFAAAVVKRKEELEEQATAPP